jgi:hypothetical protein
MPPFMALRLECGPMPIGECASAIHSIASAHGWPEAQIASITFVEGSGRYVLIFEDGRRITGVGRAP